MAQVCKVCTHEQLELINSDLAESKNISEISRKYNVSWHSLKAHRENHLPAHMVKAKEAEESITAGNLLSQVQFLQEKALSMLGKAEQAGDMKTALQGVREARGCLELLAKMQGELQQEGTVNITLAPEWMELRAVILQAVEPYPEARESITVALRGCSDAL